MAAQRVLILLPYPPGRAPSQRFRIEHYIGMLNDQGYDVTIAPFLDEAAWAILYRQGNYVAKALGLLRGFARRYRLLFSVYRFTHIWVHRETAPLGLPLYGLILTRLFKRRVIFEFDDAVWMPNVSESNRFFAFIKPYRNALFMMRNAHCNVAGNPWLAEFAQRLNSNTVCLPTVVDTLNVHNRLQDQSTEAPVIGWTGSHSTLKYLEMIAPRLRAVYAKRRFTLVVISDVAPEFEFPDLQFIEWKAEREVADLLTMHIGLMPLPDAEWARGKCGLKLIQYMALGIVPVASAVGVNPEIVQHGEHGFLCHEEDEWEQHLLRLLADAALRRKLSAACRPSIVERYSVASQRNKFLHLFTLNNATDGEHKHADPTHPAVHETP